MPIVARHQLGGGPGFYGLMLGFTGAGAICGTLTLPRLRARLGADGLVLGASLTMAASTALLAPGGGLAVVAFLCHFRPLPLGDTDLTPSMHWPAPTIAADIGNDRGPVIVTVDYDVAHEDRAAFVEIAHALAVERRRDGAYAWGLSEDAGAPAASSNGFPSPLGRSTCASITAPRTLPPTSRQTCIACLSRRRLRKCAT